MQHLLLLCWLSQRSADHQDGLLDVNWLTPNTDSKASTLVLLNWFFRVLRKQVSRLTVITQMREVTISADEPLSYVIDGEVKTADKLVVEVSPKSLSVITSKSLTLLLYFSIETVRRHRQRY